MKRLLLILWLLTAAAGSRISAAGRTELNQGWKFRQYGLGEWLPAAVPGTVHTDLLANGQIPDPFYGSSQSDLQWIDKTDWEYCCTFDAPELASYDNVRLVFEGVDCYADIRLNGELLHRTGNMFRTWKSDVKGLLKSRNNRLHVVFHSPVMQGLKNMAAHGRQDAGCRDAFNRRAVRDSLPAVVVSQRNGRALPLRRGAGAGKRGEGA